MELYFFRNVSNYDELKEKTCNAYRIKSKNKRKVEIVKRIKMEARDANYYFENIKSDNQYVVDNLEVMKKEDGIWYCIELAADDKSIIVMADGYPYAKFAAIRLQKSKNTCKEKNTMVYYSGCLKDMTYGECF